MADKKEQKVILEREYNVPLRKGWLKAPRYKRSKKAVTVLKQFLEKHMKSDDVKLGMHVNQHIWKHGIKNPPHHVKVKVLKFDDGSVKAELEGKEFKGAVKIKPKEEKATGLKGKLQDVLGTGKKDEDVKTEPEVKKSVSEEVKKEDKAKEETQSSKTAKKTPAKKYVAKKKTVAKKAAAKPKSTSTKKTSKSKK